jgi:hypothetical protein
MSSLSRLLLVGANMREANFMGVFRSTQETRFQRCRPTPEPFNYANKLGLLTMEDSVSSYRVGYLSLTSRQLRGKYQYQGSSDDSINRKRNETAFAYPSHEPCDRKVRHQE